MAEQIPTQEEYRLLEKTLMEKVLERSANDPQWRQWLIEDPEAAMGEAAFPEAQKLMEINERLRAMQEDAEVVGHIDTGMYSPYCIPVTVRYDCSESVELYR